MKQNKIFKIIGSLMILLTIMSVVQATTISNSLSTFTGIIDMGTNQIYNITNVNTTNIYASVVNTTNLWIGTTKVNSSNLLPLACSNNSVGKYDTATGTWLCQTDQTGASVDNNDNVTAIQVTGTGTKTLTLQQSGANTNLTATFTDIDTDTDTTINVTSIQVTGTTSKILTLEQLFGIANRTATWTDLDTVYNTTSIQFTGTATKTFTLEQTGSSAITNKTATFTDLTNSSADMIFAVNNTAGLYTFQGLNISTSRVNMNAQNITYTQGSGGIILNQSQSHFSIQQNSSGCVVIKGASSTLAVC